MIDSQDTADMVSLVKNPGPEDQTLDCPERGLLTKTEKFRVTIVSSELKLRDRCAMAVFCLFLIARIP